MSTTTSRNVIKPIPSDATLVWLASERAAPLFRTLDRAKAFGPLVALLAVLPAFLATFNEVLSPVDAAWGLRALDVTGAELPPEAAASVEAVCPGDQIRPAALWLSAGMMRIADPAAPVSGSVASLTAGVLLIGLLWLLTKTLSGRRFALWAVVLAAFHPTLTALSLYPVPVTAALALGLLALWGHSSLDGRPLSVALAWGAVAGATAIGLWLTGPTALLIPVVIVGDGVLAWFLAARTPVTTRVSRGASTPDEVAVRRFSAALAGVLIWSIAERVSPEITSPLVSSANVTVRSDVSDSDLDIPEVPIVGPLWGLAAIGIGRMSRLFNRRATSRSTRPIPRLLLVWLVAAGAAALWLGDPYETRFVPANRYLIAFASLPLLAAAAYGIEEAARRTVSGAWVLLAVSLPLAVRLGSVMASLSSDGPAVWITLALAAAAATWLVAKVLPAIVPLPGLRRGVLMAAIFAVIAVNSGDGLAVLFRPTERDDTYGRLRANLAAGENIDAIVLLTDAPITPELAFALRSSKPHALMEIAPTWDEASIRLERKLGPAPRRSLAAVWGLPDTTGAAAAEELRPLGEPLLFQGRELLLYLADGSIEAVP